MCVSKKERKEKVQVSGSLFLRMFSVFFFFFLAEKKRGDVSQYAKMCD